MELKSLKINRGCDYVYEPKKPLVCTVEFKSKEQETSIVLDESFSQKILKLCAEEIETAAKRVATQITAATIISANPQKAIEAQK